MQQSIRKQAAKRPGNRGAAHKIRHALCLLLAPVDHRQVQIQAGEEACLAGAEDQAGSVQRGDIRHEPREDGGDGPDYTQPREDVPRGELLHEHGPGGFEEHVGHVEDGDGGGELAGRGADGFGHACYFDISCRSVSSQIGRWVRGQIPMLVRSRKQDR